MRHKRERVVGSEPCLRCGAARKEPCRDYRKVRKVACRVVIGCARCGAQLGRCKHRERTMRQGELFGPESSAWMGGNTSAIAGRTADDQRRTAR